MYKRLPWEIFHLKKLGWQLIPNFIYATRRTHNFGGEDPPYVDIPKPCRRKSERKPYPTPMKVLIQRAKAEREARKARPCRMLEEAPENGLLVPELVEVAHQVHQARGKLLQGLSKLVDVIAVKRCRFCSEVHIGCVGHEIRSCTGPKSGLRNATHAWRRGEVEDVVHFPNCFHLQDRVGKPRIGHDERSRVQRLPAIVELCIQAGLNLKDYPTRRRTKPVYWMDGRIVDFESEKEEGDDDEQNEGDSVSEEPHLQSQLSDNIEENLSQLSINTLESWFEMISGTMKIMKKYSVLTCGYCPEVQVGPKGHKVRLCRASKHQSRDGMHAWQEATIDDLIGPNYVWHVWDPHGAPLLNDLKRYYGKAPAVVELCVQAGAPVPDEYRNMMRLDVVPPGRDEVDLVA